MWSQMLLSTHAFLKSISNVSGKDISPLIKQWVYPCSLGCCAFTLTPKWNRHSKTKSLPSQFHFGFSKCHGRSKQRVIFRVLKIRSVCYFRNGEAPLRRRSIAFVLSCLGSVQLFQVTCICFESLTFRAQRPERRGEVLWQLCLQQEEECAGVGDPSGLHIIWNPKICGEPLRCRGENERARVCVQVERKKKEENNHLNLFLEIRRMTNLELFFLLHAKKLWMDVFI